MEGGKGTLRSTAGSTLVSWKGALRSRRDVPVIETTTRSTEEQSNVNPKSTIFAAQKLALPAFQAETTRLRQSL